MSVALAEKEEAGEEASWSALLSQELSELDGVQVRQSFDDGPNGSKGVRLGALFVLLTGDAARMLVEVVRGFVVRTGRTVEVSIDGDAIKITGASREQQDKVIEAWLARHSASS